MAGDNDHSFPGADPFTSFWTDMMGKMAAAGAPAPSPAKEWSDQMRKACFDAMAEQADQFMRSEAFLGAMKQSMDNSLAWREQMNQFLTKGWSTAQMSTRADADDMVRLVRGMESRLSAKLEELSSRIEQLESEHGRKKTKGA
jgi:hypothetical protein